jgi:predicted metal-binding membrane protein
MSAGMTPTSALLAAGLLVAAGLYQITPVKQASLRHCPATPISDGALAFR